MKLSRILPLVVGGAVAGIVVSSASPAQALSYTFSFNNEDGPVNGTVSGTIVLPDGDETFSATSAIINSAPAALGYSSPVDVLAISGVTVSQNSFTVTGNQINALTSNLFVIFPSNGNAFALNATNYAV